MMDKENMDELVGQWQRGEAHGTDSVMNAIRKVKEDTIRRSGGVPLNVDNAVGRTYLVNFTTAIANHTGISIVNSATGKSKHRVTAESSHRRVACLLGMIGSTYFVPVPEEDPDIHAELANLERR